MNECCHVAAGDSGTFSRDLSLFGTGRQGPRIASCLRALCHQILPLFSSKLAVNIRDFLLSIRYVAGELSIYPIVWNN